MIIVQPFTNIYESIKRIDDFFAFITWFVTLPFIFIWDCFSLVFYGKVLLLILAGLFFITRNIYVSFMLIYLLILLAMYSSEIKNYLFPKLRFLKFRFPKLKHLNFRQKEKLSEIEIVALGEKMKADLAVFGEKKVKKRTKSAQKTKILDVDYYNSIGK